MQPALGSCAGPGSPCAAPLLPAHPAGPRQGQRPRDSFPAVPGLPGALIIPFPLLLPAGMPRTLGRDPLALQQGKHPRFHPGGEILEIPALLVLFFCPGKTFSLHGLREEPGRERSWLCRVPGGCFPNSPQSTPGTSHAHIPRSGLKSPDPALILSARSLSPQKHRVNIPRKALSATIFLAKQSHFPARVMVEREDCCARCCLNKRAANRAHRAPARPSFSTGRCLWELLIKILAAHHGCFVRLLTWNLAEGGR